jgi:acetoin utilization protein AcuB
MTPDPTTITPDDSYSEALRIIRENKFHHLPVVDKKGKLIGIVTEADLLHASPSAATSLSIYELNYLLAKLTVREVMSSPVITVPEDEPLEEAAKVMVNKRISCLPVMRDGDPSTSSGQALVGMITETDIFRAFVEVLGGEEASLRVTLRVSDVRGELARLAGIIAQLGGNICSVASFRGEDPEHVYITFRLEGVDEEDLLPALKDEGEEVVHVCCAA